MWQELMLILLVKVEPIRAKKNHRKEKVVATLISTQAEDN